MSELTPIDIDIAIPAHRRPKPSAWANLANNPGHPYSAHRTPSRPSFRPPQTIFQAPPPRVLHLQPDQRSATRKAPTTSSPSVAPGRAADRGARPPITILFSRHPPRRFPRTVPQSLRGSADLHLPPRLPVIPCTPRTPIILPLSPPTRASPIRPYQHKFGLTLFGIQVRTQRTSTSDLTMRTIMRTGPYSPNSFNA